jgi:dihydroorotase-like cyclic amidohydrolase
VELFTTGPARVLGMERKIAAGQPADLTIFSTERAWTYNVKESQSKSRNSPFDGRAFKGAPAATVVAGRVVYKQKETKSRETENAEKIIEGQAAASEACARSRVQRGRRPNV